MGSLGIRALGPPHQRVHRHAAGRPAQLRVCLASLANQESPPTFEILVCANNDSAVDEVVRDVVAAKVIHVGRTRRVLLATS